jgi:thiamine-phosphate diphosphorylase
MRPRIVLVSDPAFGDEPTVARVKEAASVLPRGTLCVQLRDKRRPLGSLRAFAWQLRVITSACGASLVVNGDARLARDVGADGVHLGAGAGSVAGAREIVGERAWISVAAHSDDDVLRAVGDGADAVLVSPIFATRAVSGPLRTDKTPRGLAAIRSARALAPMGVGIYALGGVDALRAPACAAAGADGVAVVRAILGSDAPARAALAIHDALTGRW